MSDSENAHPTPSAAPAPTPAPAHVSKVVRRAKPGRKALRDIKKMQTTGDKHAIPRESIRRYIAEVVQSVDPEMRVSTEAIEALRTAAEATLTQTFALAGSLANELSKKDTVDLPQFRVSANILLNEHRYSTAGAVSGALMAPL